MSIFKNIKKFGIWIISFKFLVDIANYFIDTRSAVKYNTESLKELKDITSKRLIEIQKSALTKNDVSVIVEATLDRGLSKVISKELFKAKMELLKKDLEQNKRECKVMLEEAKMLYEEAKKEFRNGKRRNEEIFLEISKIFKDLKNK